MKNKHIFILFTLAIHLCVNLSDAKTVGSFYSQTFCIDGIKIDLDVESFLSASLDKKTRYDGGESFEINSVNHKGKTFYSGFFNKNDSTSELGLFEVIDNKVKLLIDGAPSLMFEDGDGDLYIALRHIKVEGNHVIDDSILYKLSIFNNEVSTENIFTVHNGTIVALREVDSQLIISGMEYSSEVRDGKYYAVTFDQHKNQLSKYSKFYVLEENSSCSERD